MRRTLDKSLERIDAELAIMAGMVENSIKDAVEALQTNNSERAQKVIEQDDTVDELELKIEAAVLETMRREAPLAGDLRRLVSASRISGELERMGDYAEGIARIQISHLPQKRLVKSLSELPEMAKIGIGMMQTSLRIYIGRDQKEVPVAQCKKTIHGIANEDEKVDRLYEKCLLTLMERMVKEPDLVKEGTYILWAAHNLERIADRSVNIAERAYFQVTGNQIAL